MTASKIHIKTKGKKLQKQGKKRGIMVASEFSPKQQKSTEKEEIYWVVEFDPIDCL